MAFTADVWSQPTRYSGDVNARDMSTTRIAGLRPKPTRVPIPRARYMDQVRRLQPVTVSGPSPELLIILPVLSVCARMPPCPRQARDPRRAPAASGVARQQGNPPFSRPARSTLGRPPGPPETLQQCEPLDLSLQPMV